MGILFQIPVGTLALTKLGVVTPNSCGRTAATRFSCMAVLAAALPDVDPVTMILEMLPLVLLYELKYPSGIGLWSAVRRGWGGTGVGRRFLATALACSSI